MRRNNTNSQQILSERTSNPSATTNSSVKILCLISFVGKFFNKSFEFIAQNACKVIRRDGGITGHQPFAKKPPLRVSGLRDKFYTS